MLSFCFWTLLVQNESFFPQVSSPKECEIFEWMWILENEFHEMKIYHPCWKITLYLGQFLWEGARTTGKGLCLQNTYTSILY